MSNADELVKILVAGICSTGFAAVVKEVAGVVQRVRRGQKVREPARRDQIVDQRNAAARREADERDAREAAEQLLDAEQRRRRRWQDAYYSLRWFCMNHGTDPLILPPIPLDTSPTPISPGGTP